MKHIITTTVATALFAVLASTAQAGTRFIDAGRSGSVVAPKAQPRQIAKSNRPETTIALVTKKPQRPSVQIQIAGRSGDQYFAVPNR